MISGEELSALRDPRVIGRYAIFDEIASGGMAAVYLGRLAAERGFARTVAIKRLHSQLSRDPDFVSMFLDEARLVSRIRHPNVVTTLDVVTEEDEVVLVMEYIAGESLSKLRRASAAAGGIPLNVAITIMSGVLHGLHAAHEATTEQGEPLLIVHRDVSPQNIMVGTDGVARVLDFGVAKASQRAQTTKEGQLKGKLAYMPPEQLRRDQMDRRGDVYAASVVLWECLTGRRLFEADSEANVVMKILAETIEPPSKFAPPATTPGVASIPPELDAIVLKGLARERDERFQTAREMAIALESCSVVAAPAWRVGEWVESIAGSNLMHRANRVAEIERSSDRVLSSVRSASSSNILAPLPPLASGEATHVLEPPPPSSRNSLTAGSTSAPSSVTYATSATLPGATGGETPTPRSGSSSTTRRVAVFALLGAVTASALGFGVWQRMGAGAQQPTAAGVAAASTPTPTTPPPQETAIEAVLPAPSASASVSVATPPTPAAKPPQPQIIAAPARPKPPVVVAPAAAGKCSPPYTVDSTGIRHVKPECI